jgi:hypothetical protein
MSMTLILWKAPVVGDPDGCDLPDRWRSHPLATSTPGALP